MNRVLAPLTEVTETRHRPHVGLKILCLAVFVLVAMPRCRIELAGIPIYCLDVLAVLAYVKSSGILAKKTSVNKPFFTLLICVLAGIFLGQVNNASSASSSKEAVYMLLRYVAIISLFYSIQKQIRSERDFIWIVRAAVLGLIVTSAVSTMVSLPGTRGIAKTYILSNSNLNPDSEGTVRRLDGSVASKGRRGVSLIGTSTLTGAFVSIVWPLSLVLIGPRSRSKAWRRVGTISAVMAPFGAIFTYSRGAISGLAGAVAGLALLGKGNARFQSILVALMVAVIIGSVGMNADVFYFERIENRMNAVVEGVRTGTFEDEREHGRLRSYIEPFIYLIEEPLSLVVGAGNTRGHALTSNTQFARHSAIGSGHYYFGFVASVAYIMFFVRAIRVTYFSGRNRNAARADVDRILLACLVAMIPWWVLGHAPISFPRGMALVMLIIGLVLANQNLASDEARRSKAIVQ